jgi:hypothetical protein
LQRACGSQSISSLEADGLISRSEPTGMLCAVADINANVERIVSLLEDGEDGGQEAPEEDS